MYVAFKLVNDGDGNYPEDIKCFNTEEEAVRYSDYCDDSITVETADLIDEEFEVYQYLHVTYQVGKEPTISFKTTTSVDKSVDGINSIHAYGETVYVDMFIHNKRDGYKKIPKILEALDVLFFNAREDENSPIHHNVGITSVDKNEFFEKIK